MKCRLRWASRAENSEGLGAAAELLKTLCENELDRQQQRRLFMAQGLRISLGAGAAALSPEQERFNTLIRQIEQARQTLAAWHENVPLYAQAHMELVVPLIEQLEAGQREWAFALDGLLGQPG